MATPDSPPAEESIDDVLSLFERLGSERYSESVSQIEHACQCAALAESAGSSPALVAAALLHDIGHLLAVDDAPPQRAEARDDHHEAVGARWLASRFGVDVSVPVALHVAAKRYLCAIDPEYNAILSPASVHSLQMQGGPMAPEHAAAFESRPGWEDAVALRRWDDGAKDPDITVPPMSTYVPMLRELADR